ncbi:hypothetical protein [Roseateles sp.]|uniref:hypothetical protein n=1 Tax=Roseateles sp. TaxID=1971397 RepID=UPI0032679086
MNGTEWTVAERRLTMLVGLAPLTISAALAVVVGIVEGRGNWLSSFLMLVLPAYLTLFFFVLPGLCLLRRIRRESLWSVPAVCGLGVFLPWLALYTLLTGEPMSEYGGNTAVVAGVLLLPSVLSALLGAFIQRAFHPLLSR